MKKWTQLALIAVAALAITAAPALAGHRGRVQNRHGHGVGHSYGHTYGHGAGWSTSYRGWHHVDRYVPAYHPRVIHSPVYHAPVYVPRHRSHYSHGRHGHGTIQSGGIGIHAGGIGIHIGF